MQANFTLPPTVTRQPPHIPVPSTMMGLRLATQCTPPHCRVSSAAARIMGIGPITWQAAGNSLCCSFHDLINWTTLPWKWPEPSSVAQCSSSTAA